MKTLISYLELVEGALILNKAINPETQDKWAELELARLLSDAELEHWCMRRDEKQKFESFMRLFFYHRVGLLLEIKRRTTLQIMRLLIRC